jgi:2-polyprenyl-3-methyl-5-hydroxy-6-metoxy-1,4-benzoquinol methylase
MSSILPLFKHAIYRGIVPTISLASKRAFNFFRTGYLHTGERVCLHYPNEINEYHLNVYAFLQQFAVGGNVLDVGCGTGYGSAILAHSAKAVTAIDYSWFAVRYAVRRYGAPNIKFSVMLADELRFDDQSFDLVLSCEVFEHLSDQDLHLREVARVLKPDGLCFIATPNPESTQGTNAFHLKENSYWALLDLLGRHFKQIAILESTLDPPTKEQRDQREARIRAGLIGLPPKAPLSVFGMQVDTTHLNTRQSFFCFAKIA